MQRQKRDKMENLTAKKYLESKGLCDHDYMDSGMINHISEIMEEYHKSKLHLLNLPVVSNSALIDYIENDAEIAMPIDEFFNEDGTHITKKQYGKVMLKYLVKELREHYC